MEATVQDISRVGIIGGGTTGRGIAEIMAAQGIEVVIVEKDMDLAREALDGISANIDFEISRWGCTESEKKAMLSRIHAVDNENLLSDTGLVFDAVPESVDLKGKVLRRAEELIGNPQVVFISSIATLSITEIASKLQYPNRLIGIHFQIPIPKVPMVEVIRGLETDERTFAIATGIVERIHKKAIEVYEYPGFISSRMIVPLINEAMYILMEGVGSMEGIDQTMKLGYGFDLGPFELADRIGLDIVMSWMENLFKELGELKYRPAPLIRKKVRARHLGVKTRHGFYKYDAMGRRVTG